MNEEAFRLAQALLPCLEITSADSYWAHRASDLRGSLLAAPEGAEKGRSDKIAKMATLTAHGFNILGEAAKEEYG